MLYFGTGLYQILVIIRLLPPPLLDLIRTINDPEHPFSLEELNVLRESHVEVNNKTNCIKVRHTIFSDMDVVALSISLLMIPVVFV